MAHSRGRRFDPDQLHQYIVININRLSEYTVTYCCFKNVLRAYYAHGCKLNRYSPAILIIKDSKQAGYARHRELCIG
jgi:hypothetical protein